MKLHLPKSLRCAVLARMAIVSSFATTVGTGIVVSGALAVAAETTWMVDGVTMNGTYANNALLVAGASSVYNIVEEGSVIDSSSVNNETGYVITGNNSTLRLTDLNGSLTNSLSEGVTVNVGSGNSATVEISGRGATMSASDITRTSGNLNITVGDGATLQLTRGGSSADINGDLFIKAGGTVNSTVEDTCGWDSSSTKNVILVGEEGKLATLNLAARVTQTANVILGGNAQILSISSANAYDPAALDSFGGKIIATGTNNTIDVPVFERMALTIEVTGVDDTLDISGRISHSSRPNNAGSITKTGLGTLTLSYSSDDNTNEIYGLLSVEAGTLKFAGDTMLTTGIKVASGASLMNEGVISISSVQSLNKFGNSTTYQDVYGRVSENGYLTENYAVVEAQGGASITGVDSVRLGGDTLETLVDSATGSIYICYVDKSAYLVNTEETYDANTMGAVRQFSLAQGGTLTFDDNGTGDECRITSAVSGRGKIVLTSERETAQNYIFSGDIFGWNGTLENTPSTAVTTNVTFCGSAEINASVVNSGAGSLNVTIDNSAIGSTSAVTVNGAITATTLSITEGTTVNIRNSVVADTITLHEGALTRLNGGAVVSGNIDGSGTLQIKGNGHVSVNSFADSFAGSIDLRGGVLAVGNSLVINQGRELTLHSSSGAVLDADLSLGDGTLYLDNEGYGSGTDLNNNTLNLLGGTQLKVNGGYGNRVFNLFSNVGNLLSVDGSVLQLTAENNSITNYFDTSLLGSGDWSDSILQLTEDGTLQLVFHKDLLMLWFNERQTGGDISYHYYEKISFEDCSYTSSPAYGGAIFGSSYSNITLSDNISVTFSGNTAGCGGAIFGSSYSNITLSDNVCVTFSGNNGGAIYGSSYSNITLSDNVCVTFSGNDGGAIYGSSYSNITLSDNVSVTFSANNAGYGGGAIYGSSYSTIRLIGNNSLVFHDNHTSGSIGGAILSDFGEIIISENEILSFRRNTAGEAGGAIGGHYGACTEISNNSYVEFCENSAQYGAALYQRGTLTPKYIKVINNEDVRFERNTTTRYGGAIFCGVGVQIILDGNRNLSFSDNTSARGGAVYGDEYDIVSFDGNGTVSFTGNDASVSGGAIGGGFNSSIKLTNNDKLIFSDNTAYSGGAIHTEGNLNIRNNGEVLFKRNAEISGDTYRLRSIYAGGSGDIISFSAADGKSIKFRDSIYIESGSTVNFNADYTNAEGVVHKQTGDIIFTGATTEADLLAVKGSVGTAEEILASRTSEVYTMTNLYGGSLRIEDGAIYMGNGITVHEGAEATLLLRDGTLSHSGYDITICSGSSLSALGENIITASTLAIQDGGILQLALDNAKVDTAAVLTTTGTLDMGAIALNLTGTEYLVSGDYKLLTRTEGVNYNTSDWALNGATSEQLRWENGTLYYTCGYDWNHGVTDDDDINDLAEILGNLIINGGDITLDDVVQAIQDAVDAGFGHGQGHIVINRGGIHITGAGDLDGHIIFNGDLKDIRKLFIEKDITVIKIELGGSSEAENIVDVSDDQTLEVNELSGEGSMKKNGHGKMKITGTNNQVGGTLAVEEGDIIMETGSQTDIHELTLGNDEAQKATVHVKKDAVVTGDTLQVDGANATLINEGCMNFSGEVKVTSGHLENNGSISKITLDGGTVSGSGIFDGLTMHEGELIVGNSPGLMSFTDTLEMIDGVVVFSLADAAQAATAGTSGWDAAAYSTIDMGGNALTLNSDVNFVLEIGGAALEALIASEGASLTFCLQMIQNLHEDSLTLNTEALTALLDNTSIIITEDSEGLRNGLLHLAGMDLTSMLSDGEYSYEGNNLVFRGTITNDGTLTVPEPTTATLSLLALAGLAARRRRK